MTNTKNKRSNHPAGSKLRPGQGQMVQPSPLMMASDAVRLSDGTGLVWLCMETVHGSMQYLINPDEARQLGERLIEVASHASSQLLTPQTPRLVVPE